MEMFDLVDDCCVDDTKTPCFMSRRVNSSLIFGPKVLIFDTMVACCVYMTTKFRNTDMYLE